MFGFFEILKVVFILQGNIRSARERIRLPYSSDSTSGFELLKYWKDMERTSPKDDGSLVDDRPPCLYSLTTSVAEGIV